MDNHTPNGLYEAQVALPEVVPVAGRKWFPDLTSNVTENIRYLTEGSVWVDPEQRTVVVWRIHWANKANVASFDLLIIPEMKIVRGQPAKQVKAYVRSGVLQYCRDCVLI